MTDPNETRSEENINQQQEEEGENNPNQNDVPQLNVSVIPKDNENENDESIIQIEKSQNDSQNKNKEGNNESIDFSLSNDNFNASQIQQKKKVLIAKSMSKSEESGEKNINESTELSSENVQETEFLKHQHFFCKICGTVPFIDEIDVIEKIIKYKCKCGISNNINNKSLICSLDNENYFLCPKHKYEYTYFSKKNEENLCSECFLTEKNDLGEIYDFSEMINERYEIFEKLEKNLKIDENDKDLDKEVKNLINIIYFDFRNYSNYAHIKAIDSFNNYLKKTTIKVISSLAKLLYVKKGENNIEKIELYDEGLKDIDFFKYFLDNEKIGLNNSFANLIELSIKDNNFKNIELLTYFNFKNLQKLDISENRLDDENIKFLEILECPNLITLDISHNLFKSYKILLLINRNKNFSKIEKFFLGKNIIDFNGYDKKEKFDFSSVKEVELIRGFFNSKTIDNIQYFIFDKLEILNLSSNNLDSFDFIKHLKINSLKSLLLYKNNLQDFKNDDFKDMIQYWKKLEKINLQNNQISNVGPFEDLEQQLKDSIKVIDLTNNNIILSETFLEKQSCIIINQII